MKTNIVSIGEIAKRTGTQVSAIRFYADKGLIPALRSNSGHRSFHRSVIRRVSFILVAQSLGYRLKEIKTIMQSLPEQRTPTKLDWEKLSRGFVSELDQRISRLELLKKKLNGCIGCGCLSLKSCQLYNPGDAAAEFGTGARYLLGDKPTEFQPGSNKI